MPQSSRFERRTSRGVNAPEKQGNEADPPQFGNPAYQSNSKVGSRARVESGKAQYTWRSGRSAGLNERNIEAQPIAGWRGQFNRHNIASISNIPDGRQDQAEIKQRKPGPKQRYKSTLASNSAKTKNNWIIYVRLAQIFYNQVALSTQVPEIKYPQLISDPILQAMFHAQDEEGNDCPVPPDHYVLFSDSAARYNFDVYYKEAPLDANQVRISNPFDLGNPPRQDGVNYRTYINNTWDQIQDNTQFRGVLPPTKGLHYWPFRYSDNSAGLDSVRYGVDYNTWYTRFRPYRLVSQNLPGTPLGSENSMDLYDQFDTDVFWSSVKESELYKEINSLGNTTPIRELTSTPLLTPSPINVIEEIIVPGTPAERRNQKRKRESPDKVMQDILQIKMEIEGILDEIIMNSDDQNLRDIAMNFANQLVYLREFSEPTQERDALIEMKKGITSLLGVTSSSSRRTPPKTARVLFPETNSELSPLIVESSPPQSMSPPALQPSPDLTSIYKNYFDFYLEEISQSISTNEQKYIKDLISTWDVMDNEMKKETVKQIIDFPTRLRHEARQLIRKKSETEQSEFSKKWGEQTSQTKNYSLNSDQGFAPSMVIDTFKISPDADEKFVQAAIQNVVVFNDHYAIWLLYEDIKKLPPEVREKPLLYLQNGDFSKDFKSNSKSKGRQLVFEAALMTQKQNVNKTPTPKKPPTTSRTANRNEIDEVFASIETPTPAKTPFARATVRRNPIDDLFESPNNTPSPYRPVFTGVDETTLWDSSSPASKRSVYSPKTNPQIATAPGRTPEVSAPKRQTRARKTTKKFSPSDYV